MKSATPWLLIVAVGLLASGGCRLAQRQTIDALERQNRLLEDEIYRLRWQIQDYQQALAERQPTDGDASRGDASLDLPPFLSGDGGGPPVSVPESDDGSPPVSLPGSDSATGGEVSGEEFLRDRLGDGPGTETPDDKESLPPSPENTGPDGPPAWDPDGSPDGSTAPLFQPGAHHPPPRPQPLDDSDEVHQLRLDPAASRGWDGDGQPGDDGLLAVLIPLDESGQPLTAPGEIALALLDPALEGDDARIARWDFTAEEIEQLLRESTAPGIPLRVAWGEQRPRNEQLHLFARFTTTDGRRIQADVPVEIALAGGATDSPAGSRRAGWKPAPDASDAAPAQPAAVARRETRPAAEPGPSVEPSDSAPPASDDTPPPPKLKAPVWSPDRR